MTDDRPPEHPENRPEEHPEEHPEERPWLPSNFSDEESDRHFKATLHLLSEQLGIKTFDASGLFPEKNGKVIGLELSLEDMHTMIKGLSAAYVAEFEQKHAIDVIRCAWLLRNLYQMIENSLTSMVKMQRDQSTN